MKKEELIKKIEYTVSKEIDKYQCIRININPSGEKCIFDFKLDFLQEIFTNDKFSNKKISLLLNNIVFNEEVHFKNFTLDRLELKDVIFKKNVGIKDMGINTLILRPYEINANVVVNVDGYAKKDGTLVEPKPNEHYINNIEFEDPHICNAKVFFIGTKFKNGDFRNRLLDNVVFQNCDFENTYFLNSFLDKTTFLNCEFPIIENDNKIIYLSDTISSNPFFFLSYSVILFFSHTSLINFGLFSSILYLPFFIGFIYLTFIIFEQGFYKLYRIPMVKGKKRPLLFHHIGLADENLYRETIKIEKEKTKNSYQFRYKHLVVYKNTLKNINAMYNDLKINFRNISNMQISGDFHYSQKLNDIILAPRGFDTFALMFNYVINGFGERYIRSFLLILTTLTLLISFQEPNEDYISTQATPPFLLDLDNKNRTEYNITNYNITNFLTISTTDYKDTNNSSIQFPAYDNKFDFKYNTQSVPRLKDGDIIDSYLVRFYYATSHITYPFTQESKKWFQNMSKDSYNVSIPASIFLWLCLVGMVTAIFNRIRR